MRESVTLAPKIITILFPLEEKILLDIPKKEIKNNHMAEYNDRSTSKSCIVGCQFAINFANYY